MRILSPKTIASASALPGTALLVAAFLTVGCSYPIQNTGYLEQYSGFNAVDGKGFKLGYHREEDFSLDGYLLTKQQREEYEKKDKPVPDPEADGVDLESAQPVLFIVAPPEWKAALKLEEQAQGDVIFTVRERLYRYLLRKYPHPVRVRYAYQPNDPLVQGYRVITVKTAITYATKGTGFFRFFIGYGVGATSVQLEGRFVEGRDGEEPRVLAEFVVRDSHGGYPHGFINWKVFHADYCMKYAVEESIDELTSNLRDYIPAVQPREGGGTQDPQNELARAASGAR